MRNSGDNGNTVIIVLHEIYGINNHIRLVCKQFVTNGYDVICPDLTNANQTFTYDQEKVAYQDFMEGTGFESEAKKVENLIIKAKSKYEYVFLVGYSIGATIAWLCSNTNNMCDGIIGYYGSRIRDYTELIPQRPVLLLFPKEEKSFNIEELTVILKKKDVETHVLTGLHGFCDPFSVNYCQDSSKKAEELVNTFLNKIRK